MNSIISTGTLAPIATMKGDGLVSDDFRRLPKEKTPVRYELALWVDEDAPVVHAGAVIPKTMKIEGRVAGLVDPPSDQLLTLETAAGQRLRFYLTSSNGEIAVEDWEA